MTAAAFPMPLKKKGKTVLFYFMHLLLACTTILTFMSAKNRGSVILSKYIENIDIKEIKGGDNNPRN